MPEVDVVVVSHNSEGELASCVRPLAGAPGVRVIVVDSASTDGSLASLAQLDVDAVALADNRGFGHACNVGWRRGSGDHVLFLNPDATIAPDALRRLVEVAESTPGIGVVAPKIVEPDGTLDFSLRRYPRLRTRYAQALFLHRLFPRAPWSDETIRDPQTYARATEFEWASGACLLVPRAVLERTGGFDEGFFLYCEDLDLCRRLRDAGYILRFEPSAVAIHEGGASAPRSTLLPVLAASRVRYARKHDRPPVILLERLGIALGSLTHAVVTKGGNAARRGHVRSFGRALMPRPRPGV